MASRELICENCISVCRAPQNFSENSLLQLVNRGLRGRILGTHTVPGAESDTNLTRWIVWFESAEDVSTFLTKVIGNKIQYEGQLYTVTYEKTITCEIPESWTQMPEEGDTESKSSDGPAPPPRKLADHKPTGRDQYQMPHNAWPLGPYGAMSEFYQNISQQAPGGAGPMQEDGGLHENQGQMPHRASIPQHGQMPGQPYSQGDAHGQGQENEPLQGPPGFHGHDPRHSHHMPFVPGPGFLPGQYPMWGMPHFQPDQPNVPGGKHMPKMSVHPGMMPMRFPMFLDPTTGRLMPAPGFPNMPHQPAEGGMGLGGRPQPQRPSGPPPPFKSGEFEGQGQCTEVKSPHDIPESGQWSLNQAVSDQDEMIQKIKAKANKEYQLDTMETQGQWRQSQAVSDQDEMIQRLKAKANKEYQQETIETQDEPWSNDEEFIEETGASNLRNETSFNDGVEKSAEAREMFCQPCSSEGDWVVAVGYCQNCNEYLCALCLRPHHKQSLTKHHVIHKGKDMPRPQMSHTWLDPCSDPCSQHMNEIVKFFCSSHDAVGCIDCMVLNHRSCKIDQIQDISDGFFTSKEHTDICWKIEKTDIFSKRLTHQLKIEEGYIDESYKTVLNCIKAFRKEVNDNLDKAETEILREMNMRKQADEKMLSKLEEDKQSLQKEITEFKERLNQQSNKANTIFVAAKETKKRTKYIISSLKHIFQNCQVKQYKFEQSPALRHIITSKNPIGKLTEDTTQIREMAGCLWHHNTKVCYAPQPGATLKIKVKLRTQNL